MKKGAYGTFPGIRRAGFLSRNMIGFEYNGQVNYITRMEDFRDFMEPSVYEALTKALDGGLWQDNYKEMYEDLKAEYDSLEEDYFLLECERDYLQNDVDRLEIAREKYDTFKHAIEVLVAQYYQRYINQEDVVPTLEKLIKE